MATTRARSDGRLFSIAAGVLALSYHALIVALCSYLPQDSVAIGYGVAGYATAGCAISFLGIYGTIVQNRTLICLFSHSLLLDALISTCARVLLLELFFSTAHSQDTCSDIVEAIRNDPRQPSRDVVSSPEWQHALARAGTWCRFALGSVHVACLGVLICTCAAQGTVAAAIRSHGMQAGSSREYDTSADEKGRCEIIRDVKVETIYET